MDNENQNPQPINDVTTPSTTSITPTAQPTMVPTTDVIIDTTEPVSAPVTTTPVDATRETPQAEQSPAAPSIGAAPSVEQPALTPQVQPAVAGGSVKQENKSKFPVAKVLVIVGILVLTAGAAFYFLSFNKDDSAETAQSESNDVLAARYENESAEVLDSLSKIYLVDSTQSPTIARVEKPDDLKKTNQEFYKDIQVGDYVVLYKERAIIYRKSENKVINVAPIVKSTAQDEDNEDNSTNGNPDQ